MYIEKYWYRYGDTLVDTKLINSDLDRSKYMNQQYIKLYNNELQTNTVGKTALLYAGGPVIHSADSKNFSTGSDGSIVIKSQAGFNAYNIAKKLGNIDYVSINGDTCASSLYCIEQARYLFSNGFDNVIIYAEEMIEDTKVLLFKQLGIDIVCGDGVGILHLTRDKTDNSIAEITDVECLWNNDSSPMGVSEDGYTKLLSKIDLSDIDIVKPHGTGTERNDREEDITLDKLLHDVKVVKYKKRIGHTQGASGLIELGMLLDEEQFGTGLCIASGLGGFYACVKVVRID